MLLVCFYDLAIQQLSVSTPLVIIKNSRVLLLVKFIPGKLVIITRSFLPVITKFESDILNLDYGCPI